ncbi:hypothetical protein FB451DRAFT_1175258 [Mycena latifolia]|nr:hypothetical protein FB451DRAFT_1175258 [Mycena latifolia]
MFSGVPPANVQVLKSSNSLFSWLIYYSRPLRRAPPINKPRTRTENLIYLFGGPASGGVVRALFRHRFLRAWLFSDATARRAAAHLLRTPQTFNKSVRSRVMTRPRHAAPRLDFLRSRGRGYALSARRQIRRAPARAERVKRVATPPCRARSYNGYSRGAVSDSLHAVVVPIDLGGRLVRGCTLPSRDGDYAIFLNFLWMNGKCDFIYAFLAAGGQLSLSWPRGWRAAPGTLEASTMAMLSWPRTKGKHKEGIELDLTNVSLYEKFPARDKTSAPEEIQTFKLNSTAAEVVSKLPYQSAHRVLG